MLELHTYFFLVSMTTEEMTLFNETNSRNSKQFRALLKTEGYHGAYSDQANLLKSITAQLSGDELLYIIGQGFLSLTEKPLVKGQVDLLQKLNQFLSFGRCDGTPHSDHRESGGLCGNHIARWVDYTLKAKSDGCVSFAEWNCPNCLGILGGENPSNWKDLINYL